MTGLDHVTRRGSIYVWRRRLPAWVSQRSYKINDGDRDHEKDVSIGIVCSWEWSLCSASAFAFEQSGSVAVNAVENIGSPLYGLGLSQTNMDWTQQPRVSAMPQGDKTDTPAIEVLIEAFQLATLDIDGTETLTCMNAAAVALFGTKGMGRHFTTSLRHPKLVTAVEQSLQDQMPRRVSYQVVENGSDAFYEAHVRAVAGAPFLILSFQNATDVVQAEQMRSDFVANVSHELRTPLTSLMGFIETLRGPARDDSKARENFLAIMSGEAERMNRLVGDLQSLSGVEAGERVRPKTTVDLRDSIQTMLSNISPLASERRVTLRCDLGEAPLRVVGDSDQLIQVFTNLVENAIKYGGADQLVNITAEKSEHDAVLRGPAIAIMVKDHGPGIDPIHLPRLTERFYRADSHRSRDLGGTGLGLSIVKHILNRHRGRLKIESQVGQGSQFTVILPPA